jgi:hypothetical protein
VSFKNRLRSNLASSASVLPSTCRILLPSVLNPGGVAPRPSAAKRRG